MANHKLSLEIPDTLNSCVLRVIDTSVYNNQIAAKCPILQVTAPGFSKPQFVDNMVTDFSLNLTACQIKIQTAGCGSTFNDLPDGVYILKYSISPNEVVYVEYNHLRITKALLKIQGLLCDLDRGACEPSVQVRDRQRQIEDIWNDLDAAKAKVEFCREVTQGLQLYKYAMERLNKLKCRSC